LKEINNDYNNHIHGTEAQLNIELGSHAMLAAAQKENGSEGTASMNTFKRRKTDDSVKVTGVTVTGKPGIKATVIGLCSMSNRSYTGRFDKHTNRNLDDGPFSQMTVSEKRVSIINAPTSVEEAAAFILKEMRRGGMGGTNISFKDALHSLKRKEVGPVALDEEEQFIHIHNSTKDIGAYLYKHGYINRKGRKLFKKCNDSELISCFHCKKSHSIIFYYLRPGCTHWVGAAGKCAGMLLEAMKM
jgi:hypothetical protein